MVASRMDKDLLNDQRKHLKAVTYWADQIRNELSPILNTHSGQVHFRPNSRGFSMVGLLPKRPQRGRSGLRNAKRVAEDFLALFETYCVLPPQGRSTPEKELQSWMTAEAYRNNRQFLCIDQSTTEDTHTLFVADELARTVVISPAV